jgi:hypothetical protein
MLEKRILVKTKDNRKFLTFEKNLPYLIEFAKTFNAEIELVKVDKKIKALETKALTAAICNPTRQDVPEYTSVRKIFPKSNKQRKSVLSGAKSIKDFIEKKFLSGKPVSLKDLKDKYKNQKLSDACLCNHMASVRKSLSKKGYKFRKLAAGKYCISE